MTDISELGRDIHEIGTTLSERRRSPLTAWEQRMAATRTDVWLKAFGGTYRFAMPYALSVEFEDGGLRFGWLLGGIPEGASSPVRRDVPLSAYLKLIRLALIGGGIGVVDGERVAVDPASAAALVETLSAMPIAETWRIARAVLNAMIMGRDATPEEVAAFSIPAGPAVVPAWALERAA